MLPSLAVAFLIGLVCGAQVPYFPLSVLTFLSAIAVGLSLAERAGSLNTQSALVLYMSLLAGVIYWSMTTPPLSHHPSAVDHSADETVTTGRIIIPVQHGVGHQTMVLETDDGARRLRLVWRNPPFALQRRSSRRPRPHSSPAWRAESGRIRLCDLS